MMEHTAENSRESISIGGGRPRKTSGGTHSRSVAVDHAGAQWSSRAQRASKGEGAGRGDTGVPRRCAQCVQWSVMLAGGDYWEVMVMLAGGDLDGQTRGLELYVTCDVGYVTRA